MPRSLLDAFTFFDEIDDMAFANPTYPPGLQQRGKAHADGPRPYVAPFPQSGAAGDVQHELTIAWLENWFSWLEIVHLLGLNAIEAWAWPLNREWEEDRKKRRDETEKKEQAKKKQSTDASKDEPSLTKSSGQTRAGARLEFRQKLETAGAPDEVLELLEDWRSDGAFTKLLVIKHEDGTWSLWGLSPWGDWTAHHFIPSPFHPGEWGGQTYRPGDGTNPWGDRPPNVTGGLSWTTGPSETADDPPTQPPNNNGSAFLPPGEDVTSPVTQSGAPPTEHPANSVFIEALKSAYAGGSAALALSNPSSWFDASGAGHFLRERVIRPGIDLNRNYGTTATISRAIERATGRKLFDFAGLEAGLLIAELNAVGLGPEETDAERSVREGLASDLEPYVGKLGGQIGAGLPYIATEVGTGLLPIGGGTAVGARTTARKSKGFWGLISDLLVGDIHLEPPHTGGPTRFTTPDPVQIGSGTRPRVEIDETARHALGPFPPPLRTAGGKAYLERALHEHVQELLEARPELRSGSFTRRFIIRFDGEHYRVHFHAVESFDGTRVIWYTADPYP